MKIPFKYTIKNFGTRRLTTAITITGITLVAFVFAAVLMMAYGVKKTLVSTGSPDNVKITRKAANGEISSIIDGDTQGIIKSLPFIAKTKDGTPVISDEPVVVINLEKSNGSGLSNVTVRGVSPAVHDLRPQMKMINGRMFKWGVRELIVGESIAKGFSGAQIGSTVKFAGDNWMIVGIFSTNGSGFDSEIWGDAIQLLSAFSRGSTVSSVTLKLDNVQHYNNFVNAFNKDRRLQQFEAKPEEIYFEEQSQFMSAFIKYLGLFVTIIFSFGATIGAMITMYAAVSNRTVEVGTLRALGFSRRSILIAFLTESLIIALTGGVIGIILASLLQFVSISTLNFNSFSELAFSFALAPDIIFWTLFFAVLMGFLGGFLPSVRAARLNIVNALREG